MINNQIKSKTIQVDLFYKIAPRTVDNFIKLAQGKILYTDPISKKKLKKPFYNGLIFNRLIKKFMMQTGVPAGATNWPGLGYTLPLEISKNLKHDKIATI